jgi:hypothetical protein
VRSSVAVKCELKLGLSLSFPDTGELQTGEYNSPSTGFMTGTVAGVAIFFSEVQPEKITIPIMRKQQRERRVLFTILKILLT